MKPAQIYTYTVPANGSVQILVEGSLFKIIASTGPVAVTGDFGTLGPILAGQGMKGQNSKRFAINDMSGFNNVVRILIADESFIDDRISGSVEVIDGGKNRTIANAGFVSSSVIGGTAGLVGQTAIYVPLLASKRVVINSISASLGAAGQVFISFGLGVPAGVAQSPLSKMLGSGVAPISSKIDITNQAAVIGTALAAFLIPASQNTEIRLTEPIVINPGSYVVVGASTQNVTFTNLIQYFEELTS